MPVNQVSSSQPVQQTQREVNNNLGKDDFLKILITQLQHQDPLSPMEDRDFIAQMAQFSSLEQMQNMSQDFIAMKAMSMVGKMVYGEIDVDGSSHIIPVLGRVDSVTFNGGILTLQVGDYDLAIDDIIKIFSEEEVEEAQQPLETEKLSL